MTAWCTRLRASILPSTAAKRWGWWENPAADDASGRHRNELEHGKRGDSLAGAGFADDAEGLTAVDGQIHSVDRAHHAVVGGEISLQSLNVEQALAHGYITFRGSRVSRNPSPMKLMVNTVRKMAAPGNRAQCGAISRWSLAS